MKDQIKSLVSILKGFTRKGKTNNNVIGIYMHPPQTSEEPILFI